MTDGLDDDPRESGAKGPDAFRTISEVAEDLGLPQHVLRFWETRFPQIKPIKRGGGRRYYRPGDVELLRGVKQLLYGEGYTIRGVQRILREQGGRKLAQAAGASISAPPAAEPRAEPDFYAPRREPARAEAPVPFDPPFDAAENRHEEPAIREPTAAVTQQPAQTRPTLSEFQRRKLAAALEELNACRRLLGGTS